jgi:hypothetical protein
LKIAARRSPEQAREAIASSNWALQACATPLPVLEIVWRYMHGHVYLIFITFSSGFSILQFKDMDMGFSESQ